LLEASTLLSNMTGSSHQQLAIILRGSCGCSENRQHADDG